MPLSRQTCFYMLEGFVSVFLFWHQMLIAVDSVRIVQPVQPDNMSNSYFCASIICIESSACECISFADYFWRRTTFAFLSTYLFAVVLFHFFGAVPLRLWSCWRNCFRLCDNWWCNSNAISENFSHDGGYTTSHKLERRLDTQHKDQPWMKRKTKRKNLDAKGKNCRWRQPISGPAVKDWWRWGGPWRTPLFGDIQFEDLLVPYSSPVNSTQSLRVPRREYLRSRHLFQ